MRLQASRHKNVLLYSTRHHSDRFLEQKPAPIHDYNHTKFGVDQLDEVTSHYTYSPATRRWPIRLFGWMIDCAGSNAFALFHLTHPDPNTTASGSRRSFLVGLSNGLMEPIREARQSPDAHWLVKAYSSIKEMYNGVSAKLEGRLPTVYDNCSMCRAHLPVDDLYVCGLCRVLVCEKDSSTTVSTQCARCNQLAQEAEDARPEAADTLPGTSQTGRCAHCGPPKKMANKKCEMCNKFFCKTHGSTSDPTLCYQCSIFQ
jgi:Transposase IS4